MRVLEGKPLAPPINSGAVRPRDDFVVVNVDKHRLVESHSTHERAHKACKILNDHAESNGMPRNYTFHFLPDSV
jgi:hypothetical protein